MKIIIGMFFFSNFFLSHVHHRKDSTAKLNSVIVNCSFRLGTVTGVYHLMLCKCFRAMSQTGLFTALMQAEVLLVFCSLSHIGSLSKKKKKDGFVFCLMYLSCVHPADQIIQLPVNVSKVKKWVPAFSKFHHHGDPVDPPPLMCREE